MKRSNIEIPAPVLSAGGGSGGFALVIRAIGGAKYAFLNFVVLLAIWHVSSGYVPEYIFPSIPQVWGKFEAILGDGGTYLAILATLRRVLGGFVFSSTLGILMGVLIAMSPRSNAILGPLLNVVLGVPALTWVLLAIIWFRDAEVRVWFLMFVLVFPIVAVNTADGVRAVPNDLYQMVRSLRPSTFGMLKLVILPSATPFIFSGLKVSLSFGGRIVVFAEALSASTGIGAAMYTANQLFDTAGILVWTAILIAILYALDKVLAAIEARWFRWRVSIGESE